MRSYKIIIYRNSNDQFISAFRWKSRHAINFVLCEFFDRTFLSSNIENRDLVELGANKVHELQL